MHDPTRPPGASITADGLIDTLAAAEIVDETRLISLLGANRHGIKLDALELALVAHNVVSEPRLAALVGVASGLPVLDDPDIKAQPVLPAAVARSTGALVLNVAEPTVAFVEDLPGNVERVAQTTGRRDFHIWLVTAPRFAELFREAYQGMRTDPRPTTRDVFEVFDECVSADASDIHLSVGAPPMLRVNGDLRPMQRQPLDQMWMRNACEKVLGADHLETALRRHDVDAGYQYGDVRFRINVGADDAGLTLAARRLPSKIPTFDDLGLPLSVRRFCDHERGLILVTGQTGSGKSTTLASLLAHIALNQARHIITLEDPIEFVLPAKRALVQQRELGTSFTSFGAALRQSLRQDPDVILVGEARDLETISAAVTAAETGALVFATLHTFDAVSTLGRIVSVYPAEEQDQIRAQLSYVLRGVVSQTLVPATAGGRVGAFEVLVATPAVSNNLRKVDGLASLRQVLQAGTTHGMQTMEAHLAQLVRRGLVREGDAEYRARDVEEFRRHLQGNPIHGD